MKLETQTCADVLMIRPVRFEGNVQTASSNRFQKSLSLSTQSMQAAALSEFQNLVSVLRGAGVRIHDIDDTAEPHTPDSVFPNNWVSFHADGTAVLYPMLAPNRRLERRQDILEHLSTRSKFRIARVIDLTHHERAGKFLEGTGSLVLDRTNRIAYACISPRTDLDVLGDFAQQLDYEVVSFEASDAQGVAIYHTNVLMCIGSRFAAVCLSSIREDARESVLASLRHTGHVVLDLSFEQMNAFAGNMLELKSAHGEALVAMSTTALESLSAAQREVITQAVGPIVSAPIPTIETLGGGSVRCMLAEVALPSKE
jgi:hypothetical protein